jgi:hypothetical protein
MNQSANTRSGSLEHDINASREPRTDLLDLVSTPAAADWKPRAHLELMISMAAMVIFWTADLRVTASTRIGAPPPSSWQIPAPSCWRTRTAGRGAYAIDQRNGNARYLVAALQMERTNLPTRS